MMRIGKAGLLAAMAGAMIGTSAAAQGRVSADARWLGWIDCWQPVAAPTSTVSMVGQAPAICVVPAAGTSAVDLVSIVDGAIVSRARIEATGSQTPLDSEGCDGWKSAEWSAGGARLYLRSESTCEGGLKRSSTGMLSMVSPTEWIDVQSVTVGDRTAVRVLRYGQAASGLSVPDEIAEAVRGRRLASATARVASAAEVTHVDIIDAARHVNSQVIEAWLLERNPSLTVNARQLVQLADAGVPERVLDLVVALANQDKFTINAAERVAMAIPESTVARGSASYFSPFDNYWYGGYGMYSRSGRFGAFGYSPYGYYPYGYGRYFDSSPVVVVVTPPATGPQPEQRRGRVVNGRGYTRSGSSSTRENPSTRSGDTGSRAGRGSRESSGESRSGGSTSGGSSSGGETRTAKPRTPPPGA
jgi:uncharacterized membrane protein YgcG